jgi:hypothetical protein
MQALIVPEIPPFLLHECCSSLLLFIHDSILLKKIVALQAGRKNPNLLKYIFRRMGITCLHAVAYLQAAVSTTGKG